MKKKKNNYEPTAKDFKFAGMIRRAAFKFLKLNLDTWLFEPERSLMSEMVRYSVQDFLDLVEISECLETHGPIKTYSLVWELDIQVRDEIPMTAYNYICGD